jgi:hypothetical protein
MSFHLDQRGFANRTVSQNRSEKERRVRKGRAHAALVYDSSVAVGCVSSGRRKSFPASRISGLISMASTTFPIGGSLAFSSIGIIDARGSHPSLSRGPCAKFPASEEVAWKATRKRPTVARCHRRFFTTELFPCSSARASSDPVAWARTIG